MTKAELLTEANKYKTGFRTRTQFETAVDEYTKALLQQTPVSGSLLFTKEQVYRIVANFALSVNTEAFCGGGGTTTQIAEELKKFNYVDFSCEEKSQ